MTLTISHDFARIWRSQLNKSLRCQNVQIFVTLLSVFNCDTAGVLKNPSGLHVWWEKTGIFDDFCLCPTQRKNHHLMGCHTEMFLQVYPQQVVGDSSRPVEVQFIHKRESVVDHLSSNFHLGSVIKFKSARPSSFHVRVGHHHLSESLWLFILDCLDSGCCQCILWPGWGSCSSQSIEFPSVASSFVILDCNPIMNRIKPSDVFKITVFTQPGK